MHWSETGIEGMGEQWTRTNKKKREKKNGQKTDSETVQRRLVAWEMEQM